MSLKKHVGRLKNTDRRCVVVMNQIPGREDHALVVDTDALPDRFHDALMHLVDSHEGQSSADLHSLLGRRILPDFGVDVLSALHNGGGLQAQPISNVIMYPQPHSPCPLSLIVEMMANNKTEISQAEQTDLENRHLENQKLDATEDQIATARNLLIQAEDLEAEAAKKRKQAYMLAPVLAPTAFPEEGQMKPGSNPETPAEAVILPAGDVEASVDAEVAISTGSQATVETIATVEDISPPAPGATDLPFDAPPLDPDLPPDVAAAYAAAVEQANSAPAIIMEGEEEPAHAVDTDDDAIQAFLDRAAYREDKANKIATEAAEPKRPVGRPRKDGSPAGSPRA